MFPPLSDLCGAIVASFPLDRVCFFRAHFCSHLGGFFFLFNLRCCDVVLLFRVFGRTFYSRLEGGPLFLV